MAVSRRRVKRWVWSRVAPRWVPSPGTDPSASFIACAEGEPAAALESWRPRRLVGVSERAKGATTREPTSSFANVFTRADVFRMKLASLFGVPSGGGMMAPGLWSGFAALRPSKAANADTRAHHPGAP